MPALEAHIRDHPTALITARLRILLWLIAGAVAAKAAVNSAGAVAAALGLSVLLARQVESFQIALLRENAQRRRSQSELAQLHAELVQRVRARTAELAAVIDNSHHAIWSIDRSGAARVMNGAPRRRLARRYGRSYDARDAARPVARAVREQFHALYERAFAGEHVQLERTLDALRTPGRGSTFRVTLPGAAPPAPA